MSRGHHFTKCRYCCKEYVCGDCITSNCELGRGDEKRECPGYQKYIENQDKILDLHRNRDFSSLLKGIKALTEPDYHKMNDTQRLLHVVLLTYIKHHMQEDIIGWNELGNALYCVICNVVGDDEFVEWGDRIRAEIDAGGLK